MHAYLRSIFYGAEKPERGYADIIRYLVGKYIESGEWDVKFESGRTLLHFAAYGGDLSQVKYLVEKGAGLLWKVMLELSGISLKKVLM